MGSQADFSVYAQKHGLFDLFEGLVKDLIKDKPADPLDYMIHALRRSPVPRVIVLGPPAAGKRTLSAMLATKANAVDLSITSVLLDAIEDNVPGAKAAHATLSGGGSIPSVELVPLVARRVAKADCLKKGYFLHGLPRTRAEALALQAAGVLPTHVLQLEAPDNVLIERFKGRRVDPVTGAVYHMTFNPPPADVAARVERLASDTEAAMTSALVEYHRHRAGIAASFSHVLHAVNVDQPQGDAAEQAWTSLCTKRDSHAPFTPRIVLLGPPGSGRSTQAQLLAARYKLVNVSAGSLVRRAVAAQTELGQVCSVYLQRKTMLPDALMVKLVRERLQQSDCVERGWVLRGFPRTREQAAMLRAAGLEPNRVLALQLAEDVCRERVCGRRVDTETGQQYHVRTAPAEIASRLVQHKDDAEDVFVAAYTGYAEHIEDLLDLYPHVQRVPAHGEAAAVFEIVESSVVHPRGKDPVA